MNTELHFEDFKLAIIALFKNKTIIILFTLVGLFLGMIFTSFMNKGEYYQAKASVYSVTYGAYEISSSDARTMVNYSDIVTSKKVSEFAASLIKETSISTDEIRESIHINYSDNSYVMNIYAIWTTESIAIKMANAVAEAFVTEVSNITGNEAIQILDEADQVTLYEFNNPNTIRLLFVAGFFMGTCGIIAIRQLFTNKVTIIEQCVLDDNEILGIIPDINHLKE